MDQILENSALTNLQPPIQKPTHKSLITKKYFIILGISLIGIIVLSIAALQIRNHPSGLAENLTSEQTVSTKTDKAIPTNQVTYTQEQLTSKGHPNDTSSLSLGDNKYTTTTPKKGYIYLCRTAPGQGGAQETGSWISGTTWNLSEKPSVEGKVFWPNATFSNTTSGSNQLLTGNDLPVDTMTGTFPIQSTDPAYQYDRNPNRITAHTFSLSLPLDPTYSLQPSCMGGEVGVMLNGVPLFNGFDAENRDAAAHEVQDSCDGHPQESGEYHYHSLSRCIKDIKETTIIGYALDGFPITGPVLDNGNYLTTNDLDECHGLTSEILDNGKKETTYHYVMTEDFPYSVSCFRGKPVSLQVISGLSPQGNSNSQGGQSAVQNGGKPQPPQEAIIVCDGKIAGTNCEFSAPRGQVSGTCQTPPGQTTLVCAPTNSEQNQAKPIF